MPVNLQRLHVRPLLITEPDENKVLSVRAHPEHAVHGAVLFAPHVIEALLDLIDQLLVVGRITMSRQRPRVFVFNDYVAVDGIWPPGCYRDIVVNIQSNFGSSGKLLKRTCNLHLQIHF